ncbi:alpha-mannosidase [Deinococcus cellulosilyticus]|uniref:Alpha-mannosidase n=1 Tax=Deinococcus cellulosilyticus (strain DSM 18568 / NBRC 106333 / KACC 11606 / 5516J-15) TaxID=1223518 RepID=A0A511N321_DEIC1|nr:glycoside hydrolase family 38 C-terminal domain-containing protein [Deinococcus cellulosilyticus]GEM47249.1 alpha-mannosidase [Deinococcus cellulosilyticus NBRC 106333 = KACC 11606]
MTTEQKTYTVHMYHHTHWDREWWSTLQRFRFRLVHTIDRILDTVEQNEDFTNFVLDGQTIVLKDYLEVRPQQLERLKTHINSGKLFVGPWHILPDEFLVSGEATIRNLWLGERTVRSLGIKKSMVGYLPDQFGHIAQMPQILQGFGVDNAIVWRGFGAPPLGQEDGTGDQGKDYYLFPKARNSDVFPGRMQNEFWWEAPNGTRVLGIFLPLEYYRSHFKEDPENPEWTHDQTVGRAMRTLNHLKAFAATDYILEPMGGDHLNVDPRLPRLLKTINAEIGKAGFRYEQTSLDQFIQNVKTQQDRISVVWKGEGRAFGRKAHILPGVFSARLYLKQYNYKTQTELERYAEPLQAITWTLGERYEQDYLWLAWDRLIQNHPHDSICGCSIDAVHREMIPRFEEALQIGQLLKEDSLQVLANRVRATFSEPDDLVFVVFNPLNWNRTDQVVLTLNPHLEVRPEEWALIGENGQEIPFQVRQARSPYEKAESFPWLGIKDPQQHDMDSVTELYFVAEDLPGVGYRTYALRKLADPRPSHRIRPYTILGNVALHKGNEAITDLAVGPRVLENRFLKVTVNEKDGSLTLEDRETGHVYEGLNQFVDGGDNGDTYNYGWPLGDLEFSTRDLRPHIQVLEAGAASSTLRVTWKLKLPASISENRQNRSDSYTDFELHSDITLHAGVKRVDIRTHFVNTAKDHRLRAVFPLGRKIERSSAESQFCVVDRPARLPEDQRGSGEPAVHEHPQMAFVSVTDGEKGLSILNRGLPEFSADEEGNVFLTVLRAVGYLSREDFLTRVGGAGPTSATPDAQTLGPCEAEYSIYPHAGTWEEAQTVRVAHAYNAPLVANTRVSQIVPLRNQHLTVNATLPDSGSFLKVEGNALLTALKRAEDQEALVVRLVNQSSKAESVTLKPLQTLKAAFLTNMLEQPTESLSVLEGAVTLDIQPWQIVTVLLEVE